MAFGVAVDTTAASVEVLAFGSAPLSWCSHDPNESAPVPADCSTVVSFESATVADHQLTQICRDLMTSGARSTYVPGSDHKEGWSVVIAETL